MCWAACMAGRGGTVVECGGLMRCMEVFEDVEDVEVWGGLNVMLARGLCEVLFAAGVGQALVGAPHSGQGADGASPLRG